MYNSVIWNNAGHGQVQFSFLGHTHGLIGDIFFISKLGSAMNIALEAIENDTKLLENISISTHFADTLCSRKLGVGSDSEIYLPA